MLGEVFPWKDFKKQVKRAFFLLFFFLGGGGTDDFSLFSRSMFL